MSERDSVTSSSTFVKNMERELNVHYSRWMEGRHNVLAGDGDFFELTELTTAS